MRRAGHFDVLVIGAGSAGLAAGVRLAQLGARTCVIAKGIGATHLAPGTIDVLGYLPEPVDEVPEPPGAVRGPGSYLPEPVSEPAAALGELVAREPGHPYALIGLETLRDALRWFAGLAGQGPQAGYRYIGDLSRNFLLPTALGALKPSALVPETFAAGDRGQLGRVCVIGVRALRDFHAQLCASNLRLQGVDARALELELELERADISMLDIARHFDDGAWRAAFAARLAPLVRGADQLALPAMLGLRDPHAALADLEARLGRPVFEIASLPPSVPGMRLDAILRAAFERAGGRLVLGAGVIAHTRTGERITAVASASAGSPTAYGADAFVLASGGFHSGAITLDSRWRARELLFDLPLAGLPAAGQPRFTDVYLAAQPLARAGVAVGPQLRALGAENVVVVGAALPGAVPWREASGEGIALASGYLAAGVLAGRHPTENGGSR